MKNVLRIVLILIALLLVFISTRPSSFHIERSTTIAAPASVVFSNLDDFHRWEAWSPWGKIDPQMKVDYSGPGSGVGAMYHWVGNDKVGEGSMKITEATPDQKVGIQLEFLKPFKASNATAFTLAPDGTNTKVTWTMDGGMNFISKAMCIVQPMDKMIGPDFEHGLAQLKSVSEDQAVKGPGTTVDSSAAGKPKP